MTETIEQRDVVVRHGRSDCPCTLILGAPRPCTHWFVESPFGQWLQGPFETREQALEIWKEA